MPVKPPEGHALLYNVSIKVNGRTMDALDTIKQVSGKAHGTIMREAFEDQVAGLSSLLDPGYRAARDLRVARLSVKVLRREAWVAGWMKDHEAEILAARGREQQQAPEE